MSKDFASEQFRELRSAFIAGRISRRTFIHHAATLGMSGVLLNRLLQDSLGGEQSTYNVASDAATESPTTRETIDSSNKPVTVIEHVLGRLKAIGISEIFGVVGDYSFPVGDAVVETPGLKWVGCCNELNAAYAADGYARIHGVGAVCTTFGVGELSAINAVAGAYAEQLPIFHLVGMPALTAQAGHLVLHHTLGNGEFDLFLKMAQPVVCASAIMTPDNVAYETERLIREALYQCRPVYMAFPFDSAKQGMVGNVQPLAYPVSDATNLRLATDAVIALLEKSGTACVLPGFQVVRAGARTELQSFVDASGLPFATMFMDKSVLDEQQPSYMGMYIGKLMDEPVRGFVESCDLVLVIGTLVSDLNTGAFTARVDPVKVVTIGQHHVQIGPKIYQGVEIKEILVELTSRVKRYAGKTGVRPSSLGAVASAESDSITAETLYPRLTEFLKPNDILFVDNGTSAMGLAVSLLPKGVTFHNQTLWSSIGWATAAAFGAAVAATDRRLVLVTGEGAHQVTVQEISQFGRRGLKPIVFVINNGGYLIERLLCKNPDLVYNEVASWHYSELPRVLGCDGWFTARVTTCGELDAALQTAAQVDAGVYIEIVTAKDAAPPLARHLHDIVNKLYDRL